MIINSRAQAAGSNRVSSWLQFDLTICWEPFYLRGRHDRRETRRAVAPSMGPSAGLDWDPRLPQSLSQAEFTETKVSNQENVI